MVPNVPLKNMEIWNQPNNLHKKSDLRLINMQKNVQKARAALVRVTDRVTFTEESHCHTDTVTFTVTDRVTC